MDKQEYFLKKYGIVLDDTQSPEEQNQQMKIAFGVQDIETGDKPYIFVSYSHKDSAVVFPAIKAVQEKGYPVWYDDSIRSGISWRSHIAERVSNSAMVIAFMSENSVASKNCIAEVDHAIERGVPILTVKLDQSEIPDGLNMYLRQDQFFKAYLYEGEEYLTRLVAEPIIANTAGVKLNAYNEMKRQAEEEAVRKRREVEAAKAEAERKRMEEEIKRRMEADAYRIRRETLALKRKEAEEAEQQRRKEAEENLRRMKEEEEELDRQKIVAELDFGELLEVEKKYLDAKATLDQERYLRERAEQKLINAEREIQRLKLAKEKKNEPKVVTEEEKNAKKKLKEYADQVQSQMCIQTFSSYNRAILTYKNDMVLAAKGFPELMHEIQEYKKIILAKLYHDARVFDKKNRKRKAYALYDALPESYEDVNTRKDTIKKQIKARSVLFSIVLGLLYLVSHGLLLKFVYTPETTFWMSILLFVGPMLAVIGIWLIWYVFLCGTDFDADLGIAFLLVLIVCSVICLIMDPFLYPEAHIWLKIITSLVANGLLGCGSTIGVFFLTIELAVNFGRKICCVEDFIKKPTVRMLKRNLLDKHDII